MFPGSGVPASGESNAIEVLLKGILKNRTANKKTFELIDLEKDDVTKELPTDAEAKTGTKCMTPYPKKKKMDNNEYGPNGEKSAKSVEKMDNLITGVSPADMDNLLDTEVATNKNDIVCLTPNNNTPLAPPSPIRATSPYPAEKCNCALLFPRINTSLPANINSTLGKIGTPYPSDGMDVNRDAPTDSSQNSTIKWMAEPPKPIRMNPDDFATDSSLNANFPVASEIKNNKCFIPRFLLNLSTSASECRHKSDFKDDSYFDQNVCLEEQDETLVLSP